MEVDGSLVVQTLEGGTANFTCSVSNEFGSDEVTYRLIKGETKKPALLILTTSKSAFDFLLLGGSGKHRMCRKW